MSYGMASRDNVGPGWQPLLDELEARLEATGVPYTVVQIKEKFGGLRYYVDFGVDYDEVPSEFFKAIDDAELRSYVTCEFCGKPGKPTPPPGWVKTLCEECRS